jgi:arsenate reductase (thioredoxin)
MSANDSPQPAKTTVLFLCTGNSCRSQMAEGWARYLHAETIAPYSAGIEKHGMNPLAIQVMAEAGVDISAQLFQAGGRDIPLATFDYVITLCDHAHETCPYFPGKTSITAFPIPRN